MTARHELAYAQARLQAWHGRRPRDDTWRLLESATDVRALLSLARSTTLHPWVVNLDPQMDTHAIERSMRADFRAHVLRVASWSPRSWHDAVAWCACLGDLTAAQHDRSTADRVAWLLEDPWLMMQLAAERRHAPRWLRQILAAHARVDWPGTDPPRAWLTIWQSLVQRAGSDKDGPGIAAVADALERYLTAMRAVEAQVPGHELRERLVARLVHLFRREAQRPAALFCHLALTALDLQRLRGALLVRRLLPPASMAAT